MLARKPHQSTTSWRLALRRGRLINHSIIVSFKFSHAISFSTSCYNEISRTTLRPASTSVSTNARLLELTSRSLSRLGRHESCGSSSPCQHIAYWTGCGACLRGYYLTLLTLKTKPVQLLISSRDIARGERPSETAWGCQEHGDTRHGHPALRILIFC